MKRKYHYKSPIGMLCVEIEDEFITGLYLDDNQEEGEFETELHKKAYKQLQEYFAHKRTVFELPLKAIGTEFQRKVWNALQQIPYGTTCSYADIARSIDKPKACRAVGGANHRNPIMIVIPCHRVVNADGTLGGFGGGIQVKQMLLELEKQHGST